MHARIGVWKLKTSTQSLEAEAFLKDPHLPEHTPQTLFKRTPRMVRYRAAFKKVCARYPPPPCNLTKEKYS
jgi:hypothetical protein